MNYKSLLIIIMGTITISASAQQETSKKYKEVKETKLGPIMNVSAAEVWKIVGPGFSDAYIWSSAIDHSVGSGEAEFEGATCSERHCDVNAKGFNKIDETVTEYSDENRILAYSVHAGMPGFVTYANNRWRIVEVGPNQSRLEMTITMRMKPLMGSLMGGIFRKNLDNAIDSVIKDLKIYAETGKVSEEKEARNKKLARVS